jgi:hypothetical protein
LTASSGAPSQKEIAELWNRWSVAGRCMYFQGFLNAVAALTLGVLGTLKESGNG